MNNIVSMNLKFLFTIKLTIILLMLQNSSLYVWAFFREINCLNANGQFNTNACGRDEYYTRIRHFYGALLQYTICTCYSCGVEYTRSSDDICQYNLNANFFGNYGSFPQNPCFSQNCKCNALTGYIPDDNEGCTKCPSGKSNGFELAFCEECAPGTYQSLWEGVAICTGCEHGKIQPDSGKTTCFYCPNGEEPEQQSSRIRCDDCLAGKYKDDSILDFCKPCPAGKYTGQDGLTVCDNCLAGTFNANEGAQECKLCVGNTISDDLAITCKPCGTDQTTFDHVKCEGAEKRQLIVSCNTQAKRIYSLTVRPEIDQYIVYYNQDSGVFLPIPKGNFWDPKTNKVKSCTSDVICSVSEYPHLCGSFATSNDVYLQFKDKNKPLFIALEQSLQLEGKTLLPQDPIPLSKLQKDLSSIELPETNDCEKLVKDEVEIVPEGKCQPCRTCAQGQFTIKCNEEYSYDIYNPRGFGECVSCRESCPDGQYLHHENSAACENNNIYSAQEDYTCMECQKFYFTTWSAFIVAGCGGHTSIQRWHPRAERDNNFDLKQVECAYENIETNCVFGTTYKDCEKCFWEGKPIIWKKYYNANTTLLPYCPPGWYVDQACFKKAVQSNTYNIKCCKKCHICDPSLHEVASSAYTECEGWEFDDSQHCIKTDACDINEYMAFENGLWGKTTCKSCGTCQ